MTFAVGHIGQKGENGSLIMSDDKCGDCKYIYECRFMYSAMNEVVYGSD